MIEVRRLAKSFNQQALRDVSFVARNGIITGLLGANGAGKSTTLRIISGLLYPDRGSVHIDGVQLQQDGARHRSLGALLDHAGLYPRLTARENLEYFGELRGLSRRDAGCRAGEILSCLGLAPVAGRRASGFSLGERAKLALGRAIMHSPTNLLLDEPTNGLDVPTVRALRTLLVSMRNAGCCILFSSHVLDEVEQLCDEIVILAHGAVVAEGPPELIRAQASGVSLEDAFVQLTQVAGSQA